MEKKSFHRKIVTSKDVRLILGKSERSARDYMQKLRACLKKKPGQFVSVPEFCEISGLREVDVVEFFDI